MTAISRLLSRPIRLAIIAGVAAVGTSTYGITAASQNTAATAKSATTPSPFTAKPAALLNGAGLGAPVGVLHLDVRSARNSIAPNGPKANDPVTSFKWLIQEDTTGDPQQTTYLNSGGVVVTNPADGKPIDPCHPVSADIPDGDPNFPANCNWPSIHSMNAAPVVSEGDQTNWNNALALPTDGFHGAGTGLPTGTQAHPKKYLVSVLAGGYQLGGGHFTSPMNADVANGAFATVHVNLNPYPIPLGTMRIRVFNDNAGTNGQWDQESEAGLPGFSAKLSDYNGLVSVDYYGNPLCTTYVTSGGQTVIDKNGVPTVLKLGSGCVSDSQGDIVIPNLPPNRYGTSVVPPDGQTWIQTTTLEGNHDWDVWVQPNDTGFDTELVVGGEAVPFVDFGYVSPLALRTPVGVLPRLQRPSWHRERDRGHRRHQAH
jgi:hypothetical protein